jgi:hypothetical protein
MVPHEQAASCQRVLGGLANIAQQYATKRYRSNVLTGNAIADGLFWRNLSGTANSGLGYEQERK